jgi:hypothetical protein
VLHGSKKLLANKGPGTSRAITFDLEPRFEQTYSRHKSLGEQKTMVLSLKGFREVQ